MYNFHEDVDFDKLLNDIWNIVPKGQREEELQIVIDFYNDAVDDFVELGKTITDARKFAMAEIESNGYTRKELVRHYRPIRKMGLPIITAAISLTAAYVLSSVVSGHNQQFGQMQGTLPFVILDWSLPLLIVGPTLFTLRVYNGFVRYYGMKAVPKLALYLLAGGFILALILPWYASKVHLSDEQTITLLCQTGLVVSIFGAMLLAPHLRKVSYILLPIVIYGTALLIIGYKVSTLMPSLSYLNAFAIGMVFNLLVCLSLCLEMFSISVRRSIHWAR